MHIIKNIYYDKIQSNRRLGASNDHDGGMGRISKSIFFLHDCCCVAPALHHVCLLEPLVPSQVVAEALSGVVIAAAADQGAEGRGEKAADGVIGLEINF